MSQQINLYNPIFLKQKHYFSALTMVQALVVVLAGALGIYAFEVRQNQTLERVLAETDQRLVAQRAQLLKFAKDFSEQGASRALTDDLARAEGRLQQRQALLADLRTGVGGETAGFSPFLDAFAKQAMPGVWLTGIEIGARGSSLVVRGRALESRMVPAYIRALNREVPMQGRAVGELQLTARGLDTGVAPAANDKGEPARYIEFSLSIPLKEKS